MTAHRPEPVDQWFDRHQRELAAVLDGVLDVEAGLREVLLQYRHETAVDALGAVLDVEGGLAAIVPVAAPPPPPTRPESVVPAAPASWPVDPVTRLTLRADPRVATAYEALNHTYFRTHKLDADLARVRELLSEHVPATRYELVSALQYVLDLTLFFSHDLGRDIDSGDAHSSGSGRRLARALKLTNDLVAALDRAIDYVKLPTGQERDMALARELSVALGRGRALVPLLVELRAEELKKAIGVALNTEPPSLDSTAVRAFLDDFTTSDLRAAELVGVDLGGVRWSESGTRWPATVDVDDLKNRSEDKGGGIWVVRAGTATVRDLAELA
ncbi:hypothetical protein [Streptomyces hesseae]|uniref:Uncharacterized protein n=1 Tax=Streptomyces hesseae TaxID=3075519 RepID=A0ABU2SP24_9ACTN|nr:hypothetical protein [Streptomyces sp. DSM 40473]MDT0450746.1 hypothetical protein [Streptomyces sp. DSM 40473]